MPVSFHEYYATFHGHETGFLKEVLEELRRSHDSVVFLAGDSSLDNKHWFGSSQPAINGYEAVLQPPQMKADVCYWLNQSLIEQGHSHCCCLNTAAEATCLNDRSFCSLLAQDQFIRDNLTPDDYLVVSVGGNDVALAPLLCTVLNMLVMSWCTPMFCIERCGCACPPNLQLDCGCFCCGLPGCLSGTLCGWPLGMGYFTDLFKNRVGTYVRNMVSKQKPKKIIICMIYFLDEAKTGGWADCPLACMLYNHDPNRLQTMIRKTFELATKRIRVEGTEVVAFPLFEVLDGKTTEDYIQRVEPSPQGGQKMGAALAAAVFESQTSSSNSSSNTQSQDELVALGRPAE